MRHIEDDTELARLKAENALLAEALNNHGHKRGRWHINNGYSYSECKGFTTPQRWLVTATLALFVLLLFGAPVAAWLSSDPNWLLFWILPGTAVVMSPLGVSNVHRVGDPGCDEAL